MLQQRKKIIDMTREELVAMLQDIDGPNILLSPAFLREEIFRRDCETQNATLVKMTAQIRALTVAMAILTLAVTLATIQQVFQIL